MRKRAAGLARRVAHSRYGDKASSALTLPYRFGSEGPNPVIGAHYGMQLGREFSNDEAAAQHYFSTGWKLGVVPNPFVDVPAARFSFGTAMQLRNALARVSRGAETAAIIGSPSRFLPHDYIAGLVGHAGGWLAELMRRTQAENVPVIIGLDEFTWDWYLQACRDLTGSAATVYEQGLFDVRFYESQLGDARFLTPEAAFDDYLANGEFDGRTPHPFFEPEWYGVLDRSQVRRDRPINQLLDFVAHDELGQGSPHFWGQRYLKSLGDAPRPASLLRHFTEQASDDSTAPSAEDVMPVSRAEAERVLRTRVMSYHADLGRLIAHGPILAKHHRSAGGPAPDATCLVVVDERHLVSSEGVAELATVVAQRVHGLRVVVIEGQDTARHADLDLLVGQAPVVDFAQRLGDESIGAVARRLIEQAQPDAWTEWTPGQQWEPEFLATAVNALREHPQAPAAAVVTTSTPQPWLRTDDALWVEGTDGAGVAFRATGEHRTVPADLDVGFVTDLVIGLADVACAVITRDLIRRRASEDVSAHHQRAGVNTARSRRLLEFPPPTVDVGVAIPTYEDWEMTLTAVRKVLANTSGQNLRVAVIDNGSRRPVSAILGAFFASDDRVVVQRMPRNTDFALGSNLGAALAAGRTTVFLNNDTAVQTDWLRPLLAALDDGAAAAQPLLLYGDRTVQTAGTVFFGGMAMPVHLLRTVHPVDVDPRVDDHQFSALTAACMAVRSEHVADLDGFDPQYVNGMEDIDFCFRLIERTGAPLRVSTRSQVVHFEGRSEGRSDHHDANRDRLAWKWRQKLADLDDGVVFDAGDIDLLDVCWHRWDSSPLWTPTPLLRHRRLERVHEPEPRLRWAIKTAATGDLKGDVWGDTHFADALAGALRRLGHEVVIDRHSSHHRPSAAWDDVTLTLRGLVEFVPQPGAVNLLWVISHPDLVTRHELSSGFVRIYSAGEGWGRRVKERWGIDVETLIQATDAAQFRPEVDRGADRDGVLFVGRIRGAPRKIVTDVITAGGEPIVYGDDGWEQFIDPRFVRTSGIPYDQVPDAYGSAAIVLNDHWSDMAQYGFFSNRLFDAAATGARIISDQVPGIAEVFGPQVQTYSTRDELATLLDPNSPRWPRDAELRRLAHRVSTDHSFDARARVLADGALDAIRERG